jgi:hypothetical protein
MRVRLHKLLVKAAAATVVLGVSQTHIESPHTSAGVAQAAVREPASAQQRKVTASASKPSKQQRATGAAGQPKTVLTRSAAWFVYPHGCQTVREGYDLVLHFHGAHTTVIPRYLKSNLDAVLVIINKGIGSGPYSTAFGLRSQVDGQLARIKDTIAEECGTKPRAPKRVALSSWSAGYGATQQFLRLRPKLADAVLLSDGLHVGFDDERKRRVRVGHMKEFVDFAKQAARGEKLMAIAHSAITPQEYASAGETAMALAAAARAPLWPTRRQAHGMTQLTEGRRGQFFVAGFAGMDKAAHASHLYSIHRTSFARLAGYWNAH